jgi:DNA-binding CsgD family transcriptional regulator
MNGSLGIIGREAELATITTFLDAVPDGPVALLVLGEPGIGKSVLWRDCLEAARGRGIRVLSARPAESEAKIAFGGLDDLVGHILEETLPALSAPKRRALEVALLRTDPGGTPPDRRTTSRAVLDVLRGFAAEAPVMVAVDDAQWLDLPSARMLEFIVRRLEGDPIGILLTRRLEGADSPPPPFGLDRALPEGRVHVMRLAPLELAGIHELVRSRLGASFPRHVLVRLYEQSGGNPFFALEIARVLVTQDLHPGPEEELPVPDDLRQLLRQRLTALSPEARDLLLFTALLSDPTVGLVMKAAGGAPFEALQEAEEARIIDVDGERLRFTHPLFGSVVRRAAHVAKRRDVHARLAEVSEHPEEQARHLALAATGPDPATAATLEEAARAAAARGAPSMAAILSEEARLLTPAEREEDGHRRQVEAADYHFRAGDTSRARELLEDALSRSVAGPHRAGVLYRLGIVRSQEESWPEAERLFRTALTEAGDDLFLQAQLHQQLSLARLVAGDLIDAAAHARKASSLAERAQDGRLRAYALAGVAFYDFLLGHGVPSSLLERASELESAAGVEPITPSGLNKPGESWGIILKWTDDLDGARAKLEERYREAVDTGDESSVPFILYHLSEMECWAGNWERAARCAEEGHKVALQSEQEGVRAAVLYAQALVAAHRGLADVARAQGEEALRLSQRSGNVPVMTLTLSALGFIDVSLGDYAGAHRHLGPMGESLSAVGVAEPGVVKFVPDEVEALIALGEPDKARILVDQLEERGRALDRIWALATGARCRALLDAATGDFKGADRALERALEEHQRLPMPFELGRTLLVAGTIRRRAKHKRAAKESLQEALEIFERLGAPLWAEKAREELARVGLRPAAPLGLTASEQRVADLVARGMTNKEVATALFISPKTVDSNLSRIYRKLGVRSRTELAAKLSGTTESEAS